MYISKCAFIQDQYIYIYMVLNVCGEKEVVREGPGDYFGGCFAGGGRKGSESGGGVYYAEKYDYILI